MASWKGNLFKALDLVVILAPRALPNKYFKLLPKFHGNNVFSIESHVAHFEQKIGCCFVVICVIIRRRYQNLV